MSEVYCKDCIFLQHNIFDFNLLSCGRKLGKPYKDKNPVYGEIERE